MMNFWFYYAVVGVSMFLANTILFYRDPCNDSAGPGRILANFIGGIILGAVWPVALLTQLFLKLRYEIQALGD
jgi:hypothetical protein